MSNIDKIRQEIERLKKWSESSKKEWIDEGYNQNAFAEDCRIKSFDKLLAFIDSLQEEKPSDDVEQAAARYELENRQCLLSSVDIVNAFIEGAKWMANQMPQPEDTVIFQKGVAEGRRMEREDRNNDNLPRFYGD